MIQKQDELLKEIFSSIQTALPDISHKIACFDADGTLWKDDVDLHFLTYQKKNNLLNKEQLKIVKKAQDIYKENPHQACCLLAQRNTGFQLFQLTQWSQDCFAKQPLSIFLFQKKLLSFLKECGVILYVVSASPEWLVRQALKFHHLEIDEVIGVRTKIQKNFLTNKLENPLSIGENKIQAFLDRSFNKYPFFASGNTLSDLSLLENSTHFSFSVASSKKGELHYESEQKLLNLAQKNSWFHIHV